MALKLYYRYYCDNVKNNNNSCPWPMDSASRIYCRYHGTELWLDLFYSPLQFRQYLRYVHSNRSPSSSINSYQSRCHRLSDIPSRSEMSSHRIHCHRQIHFKIFQKQPFGAVLENRQIRNFILMLKPDLPAAKHFLH